MLFFLITYLLLQGKPQDQIGLFEKACCTIVHQIEYIMVAHCEISGVLPWGSLSVDIVGVETILVAPQQGRLPLDLWAMDAMGEQVYLVLLWESQIVTMRYHCFLQVPITVKKEEKEVLAIVAVEDLIIV